jgi:hypothetical protein
LIERKLEEARRTLEQGAARRRSSTKSEQDEEQEEASRSWTTKKGFSIHPSTHPSIVIIGCCKELAAFLISEKFRQMAICFSNWRFFLCFLYK